MGCEHCSGSCGGCPGSSPAEILLTRSQVDLLARFRQTPFFPMVQTGQETRFPGLEDGADQLPALAELGLISMDHHIPLSNFDYSDFQGTEQGSVALTPLGQAVLDQLEELGL